MLPNETKRGYGAGAFVIFMGSLWTGLLLIQGISWLVHDSVPWKWMGALALITIPSTLIALRFSFRGDFWKEVWEQKP